MEIEKAFKRLLIKNPFYGLFCLSLPKNVTRKVKTLCVSRQGISCQLNINPDYWETMDDETQLKALQHELSHIALQHIFMHESFPDHESFNVAADAEINSYIENVPEGWVTPDELGNKIGKTLDKGIGTKKYYEAIRDYLNQQQQQAQAQNPQKPCNGGQGGSGQQNQSQSSSNSSQDQSQGGGQGQGNSQDSQQDSQNSQDNSQNSPQNSQQDSQSSSSPSPATPNDQQQDEESQNEEQQSQSPQQSEEEDSQDSSEGQQEKGEDEGQDSQDDSQGQQPEEQEDEDSQDDSQSGDSQDDEEEEEPEEQESQYPDEIKNEFHQFDDHSSWDDFDKIPDATKQLMQNNVNTILKNTAEQVEKMHGTIPGEFTDIIEKLREKKPEVFNWKAYFRRLLGSIYDVNIRSTRRKQSKRFEDAAGIQHKKKVSILVAVDTSGSVSQKELQEFFSEIDYVFKAGARVVIVQCDTRINDVEEYDGKNIPEIKGRGGTDFNPPVDYYLKHKKEFASLIYFTDGYADLPQRNPSGMVWVISSNGCHQDFPGKAIYIPEDNNSNNS